MAQQVFRPRLPSGWFMVCAIAALWVAGCNDTLHDSYLRGPVAPSLYRQAVLENKQRLAGEDVHVYSPPRGPLQETGDAFGALFRPVGWLFSLTRHPVQPGAIARAMYQPRSPDAQRQAILQYTNFPFGRRGAAVRTYAGIARGDLDPNPDYLVRAAALRALDRSRARGYTQLFLRYLDGSDDVQVRLEAANALGNIPDPDSIASLIDHLKRDDSRDVRISCADALRNFKTKEVATALVNVLGDTDFGVAWQARQSLELMTGQDMRYDMRAWFNVISSSSVFG